jgi:hypothetical protein
MPGAGEPPPVEQLELVHNDLQNELFELLTKKHGALF